MDKEITRGKNQIVYKYLPGMWVSLKDSTGRTSTAKILNWNCVKMNNIYDRFVSNEISRQIQLFANRNGDVTTFGADDTRKFSIVEPACNKGVPDIVATLSPLFFYCSSCHNILQARSVSEARKHMEQCDNCGKHSMKQLQMVYSCECGFATEIKKGPYGDGKKLLYKPIENPYKMFYKSGKNEKVVEFRMKCPVCNNVLVPDNAVSDRNYKPFVVRIINLVDKKQGAFFEKGLAAQKIVVAKWMGKISKEDFTNIVNNIDEVFNKNNTLEKKREQYRKIAEGLVEAGIIGKDQIEQTVNTMLSKADIDKFSAEKYVAECDKIFLKRKNLSEESYNSWINDFAFRLMQYDTIKDAQRVITLEDCINAHLNMEFINDKSDIIDLNNHLGIKNMQVSCDIEILSCAYGFTRRVTDPKNSNNHNCRLKLVAFNDEKEKNTNLVYSSKLKTEGILFEIDRRKILKWLRLNNIITDAQMPDIDNDVNIKEWFAENVHGEAVTTFNGVEEGDIITKAVFSLLHSMAHAFINIAGEISGLSVESLSEIIFIETTSIFIYAQTSQGIPLGALSSLAENGYSLFLNKVFNESKNCIFDPICTDRDDSACNACLIIPEISCNHFNANLGRKYLYTLSNEASSEKIIGFWEM